MASGGTVHDGAWFKDYLSIWLSLACCGSSSKDGQSHVETPLRSPLMPYANVASTCAIPINPIMSSGETIMVRDLDLVNPTVMRPRQSSVSSVGEPSGKNRPLRKPVLGWATIATAAVPPAELAMVSTRSVLGKFFLMVERLRLFLWSAAVVITKRPSENPVLVEKTL